MLSSWQWQLARERRILVFRGRFTMSFWWERRHLFCIWCERAWQLSGKKHGEILISISYERNVQCHRDSLFGGVFEAGSLCLARGNAETSFSEAGSQCPSGRNAETSCVSGTNALANYRAETTEKSWYLYFVGGSSNIILIQEGEEGDSA